jgi:hypothetical protein
LNTRASTRQGLRVKLRKKEGKERGLSTPPPKSAKPLLSRFHCLPASFERIIREMA